MAKNVAIVAGENVVKMHFMRLISQMYPEKKELKW